MKTVVILTMAALLLGSSLAAAPPALAAGKAFLWTGKHWTQVSEDGKAGYIFGMGNLADFETGAARGKSPCISRAFVDDLKNRTVSQIVRDVDKFYQENPGKLDTPVIQVVLQKCTRACPPQATGGKTKR
jgi:hypothetical protein